MNPVDLASVSLTAPTSGADREVTPEDVFARVLVKELRRSLPGGGWLGGGDFEAFETFLDEALADQLARDLKASERPLERPAPPAQKPVARPIGARRASPAVPVDGVISSGFGERVDPIDGVHRHHHGVDIAAPIGTPIRAVRAGRVVQAESVPGYGNLVVIDHGNGLQTRYAHCDGLDVAKGAQVEAGTPIARVGQTGRATGPHLHFEARQHGEPIDPLAAGLLAP